MARVTGIGGVFFRCADPTALQAWYVEHLGFQPDDDGFIMFRSDPGETDPTAWSPFPDDTTYFGRPDIQWMVNYRVDDLEGMLDGLRARGVTIEDERHEEA